MAEVAGLALSGIALVGLFSTCIDAVEYFEQMENWVKDFQLVQTKMSLMKRRLNQWGAIMSIDCAGAEEKAEALRNRWPGESGVITESLMGIKDILTSTTHMCRRYHRSSLNKDGLCDIMAYPTSFCAKATSFPRWCVPGTLRIVRLKTIWVVQDRRKFQRLITDFDFLLSNLEKIGEQLQKESTMAGRAEYTAEKDCMEFSWSTTSSITNVTSSSTQLTDMELVQSPNDTNETLFISDGSIHQLEPNDIDPTEIFTRDGHVYQLNEVSDQADIYTGNYYPNGVTPSSDQKHNYIKNKAKGSGSFWMGNTDAKTALQMASQKRKDLAAEKARERESLAAKRTRKGDNAYGSDGLTPD